jgi:hypothetical protein
MKKLALLLVIAALLLTPALVHAQQPLKLSNLEVDLWPEYDRPSVLVIYHITLDASVSLPTELAVKIPLTAEINAVASKDVDGQLLNVNYTPEKTDLWQIVRMQVALPDLQLEFYDNSLKIDGIQRRFLYQWPGDFQVARAEVIVQQPVDATDTSITPGPVTSQKSGTDGQTYFFKEVGALNAGQGFQLEIGYQKSTDRLTAQTMTVSPSEPLPGESPGTGDKNLYLPLVLGVLGLLLIVGGIYWYWRSSQQSTSTRRRARVRASNRDTDTKPAPGEGVYCQQCGRRASPGDRFCRTCGTRLRME